MIQCLRATHNAFLQPSIAFLSAAVLCGALANAAPAAVLAHWTFDSISGTDKQFFPDATGKQAAFLKEKDKVTLCPGEAPFGKAAYFSGETDAYLTTRPLPIHRTSFTICAWVNFPTIHSNFVLTDWESFAKSAYVFGVDPQIRGNLRQQQPGNFPIADLRNITTLQNGDRRGFLWQGYAPGIHANEWHHLAWVWERTAANAGTMHLYIDGELNNTKAQERPRGNLPPPALSVDIANNGGEATVRIGSREFQNVNYIGGMDELWVFNEALKIEEVRNLMAYNNRAGTGQLTKFVTKNPDDSLTLAAIARMPVIPSPAADPAFAAAQNTVTTPPTTPVTPTPATPDPAQVAAAAANNNAAGNNTVAVVDPPTTPVPTTPVNPANPPGTDRGSVTPQVEPRPISPAPAQRDISPPSRGETRPLPAGPRNMGTDVVAKVPQGYSTMRLTAIIAVATISLFLAGFLVWAFGERSKLKTS